MCIIHLPRKPKCIKGAGFNVAESETTPMNEQNQRQLEDAIGVHLNSFLSNELKQNNLTWSGGQKRTFGSQHSTFVSPLFYFISNDTLTLMYPLMQLSAY